MKTIKLLSVVFALAALVSCSSDDGSSYGQIVGDWYKVSSKYLVDDQEIELTYDQELCLYDEDGDCLQWFQKSDQSSDMAWGIPISFYSGGKLECFFIKGTYRLKGDRVICNVMGDEYEFIREGEYLVDRENELDIYSYKVIDTWSSETINEGLADKFVKVLYYQKQ